MPEGPSIVILREAVIQFKGKTVLDAWGTKADPSLLINKKITDIRTLGKQLLLVVSGAVIRVHLLMFGTYSVNEQNRPDSRVRLALIFKKGSVFFYTCSVTAFEGEVDELFDFETDVMGDNWNAAKARKALKAEGKEIISDALLNQDIFAGSGNIIKNEVLYRVRVHPETLVKDIPPRKLTALINETRVYSFQFLEWKKAGVLKRNWEAYTKKICKRCQLPFSKKYTGKTKRRSFYCENCQLLYK